MIAATVIFWICAGLIVYSYILYAPLIWGLSLIFGREKIALSGELPKLSLLIAAHNEEAVIEQRLRNALELDYPRDRLEIVIASDGSTDQTINIVQRHADRGVKLIDFKERLGKAAAINRAMPQLAGEIVLLSDANTELDRDAAKKLVRWFNDPNVGIVCGRLMLIDPKSGSNVDGMYWKYETTLKQSEAKLGALLGANGAIYAIRRSIYQPIPDGTIVDDFAIPLLARLRKGCEILYDTQAVAREETAPDIGEEFRRRTRIGAGNIQNLMLLWPLLNPMRGLIALSFISHKVLRWLCPFFLIGLLAGSILLWNQQIYRIALLAQLVFYAVGISILLSPRGLPIPKTLRLAAMFTSMNAALLVGFCRWLFKSNTATWRPTARTGATATLDGRNLHHWLPYYAMQSSKRRDPRSDEPVHLLLCIADHFEPQHRNATRHTASARVEHWVSDYPRLFGGFRDSDGRSPQHTFFYPMELYEPDHLDGLADLQRGRFGEVEIHLHHDNDTSDALRSRLLEYKQILHSRHGLLSRRKLDNEIVYGFVHGDWALDNSHPTGRCCGVNNELDVLRETGCYADFTMPSAPSPTQAKKINSIYYAVDDPHRPRSHDRGVDVGVGLRPEKSLMLIQGPLMLRWDNRKWGVAPRIENGCLQSTQLPTERRLDLWLRARIQVPARPDWFFVKLHAHGAAEANLPMMLGEPMLRFHESLARRAQSDRNFHYHYVTARQMYNLVRAAEAGWTGSVDDARDFQIVPSTVLEMPKVGSS